MKKRKLKKKVVLEAAQRVGGFAELAKKINRTYRALLIYRTKGEAPLEVVTAIEAIAGIFPVKNSEVPK